MIAAGTKLQRKDPSAAVASEGAARANARRHGSGGPVGEADEGFAGVRGAMDFSSAGEPLGKARRAEMEASFGRDFSNVRVHANADEATQMGARAFTYGEDIAFAPGESPDTDRSLLAHELTHTVEQSRDGEPRVQRAPKRSASGIGSAPPAEAFTRSDEIAAEDDAVLFDRNEATLSTAARKRLQAVAAAQRSAVLVEVHGYASAEGEAEYNVNLSAHRGVAVRAELLRLLPEGSSVVVVAHGEVKAFGAADRNRRGGIRVLPLPPTAAPTGATSDAVGETAGAGTPKGGQAKPQGSKIRLFPEFTLDPTPLVPPRSAYYLTPGAPPPINWLALRDNYAAHGLHLDARMAGDIESYALRQRGASVAFLTGLGMHPLDASMLADALLPIAIGNATGAWLTTNYPNQVDFLDIQMKAAYPGAWRTPSLPITDVIDFLYQKKTGRKDASLFRF